MMCLNNEITDDFILRNRCSQRTIEYYDAIKSISVSYAYSTRIATFARLQISRKYIKVCRPLIVIDQRTKLLEILGIEEVIGVQRMGVPSLINTYVCISMRPSNRANVEDKVRNACGDLVRIEYNVGCMSGQVN